MLLKLKSKISKIKDSLADLIGDLRQNISKKEYQKAFVPCLKILLLLVLTVEFLWLAGTGAVSLFQFISKNWEFILGMIVLGVWGVYWIKERNKMKQAEMEAKLNQEKIVDELQQQEIGNRNYEAIRQIVFTILSSIAKNTGLEEPDTLSSLDTPRHFIERNGTLIYQFAVLKKGENVNIATIVSLIQNRIWQMINSGELGLSPTKFVHSSGIAFPILLIDAISDAGTYLLVNIAWASETYCTQWIGRQRQNRQPPFTGGGNDRDF